MKRKFIGRLIIIVSIMAICGAGIGSYLYNKPHRNISKEAADFTTTSGALYTSFSENEDNANRQFLDKVISVRGRVVEVMNIRQNEVAILLEDGTGSGGVICTLDSAEIHKAGFIQKNQEVTIKGRCTGILMEVVLVDCFIQ